MGDVIEFSSLLLAKGRTVEPVTPQRPRERPVSRKVIADMFGVCIATADRWVTRYGMPEETPEQEGCWLRVGCHKRFYPSRVRQWLHDRDGYSPVQKPPVHHEPVTDESEEVPVSTAQLARILECSPATPRNWIKRGCPRRGLPSMPQDLPGAPGCWSLTPGGLLQFYPSRVREWLALDTRPRNEMGYLVPKALRDMQEQRQAMSDTLV